MNTTSEDKDKIIAVQEELIRSLQKQIKEWEDWKASSKDRHAKGREKSNTPNKNIKKLFDLFDQSNSYMAFSIGRAGGLDEDNEDHQWLESEMDRLELR